MEQWAQPHISSISRSCFATGAASRLRSRHAPVARVPASRLEPSHCRATTQIAFVAGLLCSRRAQHQTCKVRCQLSALPRRQLLASGAAPVLASGAAPALSDTQLDAPIKKRLLYRVEQTPNSRTERVEVSTSDFSNLLQTSDVVVLGEHHNYIADHSMESDFLKAFASLHKQEKLALGLEMVEQSFQPALDRFNRGECSVQDLAEATQWSKRWGWRFDKYAGMFQAARNCGFQLVALEVDDAAKQRVQLGGLAALTAEERARFIPDGEGFQASQKLPGFVDYEERLLMQRYEDLLRAGFLASRSPKDVTYNNYLDYQLLRDEGMASAAWRCLSQQHFNRMVFLVGYYHVRFEYGVVGRLRRFASQRRPCSVSTILLNPMPYDSLSDNEELQLTMRVGGGGLPVSDLKLADFVWEDVELIQKQRALLTI